MPVAPEMKDHVYKILELVGSSEKSIDDAIRNAITRASKTIRDMKWFEVVQTRGHIENGSVRHYQVTLRVGFTLEGEFPAKLRRVFRWGGGNPRSCHEKASGDIGRAATLQHHTRRPCDDRGL